MGSAWKRSSVSAPARPSRWNREPTGLRESITFKMSLPWPSTSYKPSPLAPRLSFAEPRNNLGTTKNTKDTKEELVSLILVYFVFLVVKHSKPASRLDILLFSGLLPGTCHPLPDDFHLD